MLLHMAESNISIQNIDDAVGINLNTLLLGKQWLVIVNMENFCAVSINGASVFNFIFRGENDKNISFYSQKWWF